MELDIQGIQLQFLLNWANNKNIPLDWTTADVLSRIVLPETTSLTCSYCDYAKKVEKNSNVVGISSVFISYAWSCRFMDVLKALEAYFASNLDIYVWMDIMSFNQHNASNIDVEWVHLLKSAIKDIGRTVMVLAPWNDPTPLHRAWCVWELYCTIIGKKEGNCQFDIALSPESEVQCIEQIQNDTHEVIDKMLSAVDSKKSTCFKIKDQELIHTVIRQSVGYNELNKEIFELMREWIIDKYSQRLQFLRLAYGNTDPRTLISIGILGRMCMEHGDHQLAETLLKECFEVREATLGFNDPDTLLSMHDLGVLYMKQGKFELAEPLLKDSYELREHVLGKHHHGSLTSLYSLGSIYIYRGKYKLAESVLKECLELTESVLGKRHLHTLRSMNALAGLYVTLENYELAEPLLKESLGLSEEVFGKKHPDTFAAMNSLGFLYTNQGKYLLAESLYKECLCGMSELGMNRQKTLTVMNNLALLYHYQGNSELAESLYQECLELRQSSFGKTHPDTLTTMDSLAGFYYERRNYESAELLYKECIAMRKSVLGNKHPDIICSINNLACVYTIQGKYELAEPLYKECLQLTEALFGKNHPDTLRAMKNIGSFYFNLGKTELSDSIRKQYNMFVSSGERRNYTENVETTDNPDRIDEKHIKSLTLKNKIRNRNKDAKKNPKKEKVANVKGDREEMENFYQFLLWQILVLALYFIIVLWS